MREQQDAEQGFTLVELLVVTMVIAILAAIAIPTYVSQSRRGFDGQMKSALRAAATSEEAYLAGQQRYGSLSELLGDGASIAMSTGVKLDLLRYDGSKGFCLKASHLSSTATWMWDSESGGLQPSGTSTCPTVTSGTPGDQLP